MNPWEQKDEELPDNRYIVTGCFQGDDSCVNSGDFLFEDNGRLYDSNGSLVTMYGSPNFKRYVEEV